MADQNNDYLNAVARSLGAIGAASNGVIRNHKLTPERITALIVEYRSDKSCESDTWPRLLVRAVEREVLAFLAAAPAVPVVDALPRYEPHEQILGFMQDSGAGEYVRLADVQALLATVQIRPKVKFSPEMQAALDKAAETGATFADTPDGIAFINYGHDYGSEDINLNCPACGGSGHVDDSRATPSATPADPEQAKLDSLARQPAATAEILAVLGKYDLENIADRLLADLAALPVARQPQAAPNLPTNDEVYAEVCRERGKSNFYVSTNAVNDVMAAVRKLAIQAAPEATSEPAYSELRRAVKAMTSLLADREWAEHISRDKDAASLESEITRLVGATSEQMGGAQVAKPEQSASNYGDNWHSLTCDGTCRPPCAEARPTADAGCLSPLQRYVWAGTPVEPLKHLTAHEGPFYACADVRDFIAKSRAAEGEATSERKPLTIVEAKAEAAAPEAPDDAQGTPYFRDVEFDPPSGLFTTITSLGHGIGSDK